MVPPATLHLVLRAPGGQGVSVARPTSPRTSSSAGWPPARRCSLRAPTSGPAGAAPGGAHRRVARRAPPDAAALIHDLGKPDALPQHDASCETHVADVDGHVDPGDLRPGGGPRRRGGDGRHAAAAVPGASEPAPRSRRAARGLARRGAGAGARVVHRSPPLRHGDPGWHAARRELPFVFAGSAAAAAGGLAMLGTCVAQAAPARRMAVGGAVIALVMEAPDGAEHGPQRRDASQRNSETAHATRAARSPSAGAVGTLALGRHRSWRQLAGAAFLAGSACTRFAIFEAGQESARDPRYTVVPQRRRM